jgi:hypothetical protein
MGSAPTLGRPVNVFEFNAGFALRIIAMRFSPFLRLLMYRTVVCMANGSGIESVK